VELHAAFIKLGIALGLGLLVGLQRERTASALAGFRTFPLIALLGALTALLGQIWDSWVIAAGFIGVAAATVVGNLAKMHADKSAPGITTEIAALVMYAVGAYTMVGQIEIAVAVGGVVAILLHLKEPMHALAKRMEESDVRAVMQFAVITLVILPVLPDRGFGPGDPGVLNPRKIWLMVVLIVGISLAGYIAYKLFGQKTGALLGGVLGGLISSTATTVSYARRSREAPETANLAALVILIASAVAFVRVLVEIGVVAPGKLRELAPPLAAMLALMVTLCGAMYVFVGRGKEARIPPPSNPAELKPALVFAALYAVVLLAVHFAHERFASAGLYAVAGVSGLTDMDAITLSTAQLVNRGEVEAAQGWRAILIASLSNLLFKGAAVAALGGAALLARIGVLFGLAMAGGVAIFFLWPA
jgi:uncharacterized membrane protein (DUF4010 family)